jgi:hypothetical protein
MGMDNGNKRQSEWSQEFHATRGGNLLPCPVPTDGGCGGDCKTIHPFGIGIKGSGQWYVRHALSEPLPVVEHYA